MPKNTKISPAFEPFLADSKPSEKRDAIVIFRAPEGAAVRPRGSLRSLKQRLDLRQEARRRPAAGPGQGHRHLPGGQLQETAQ